MEFIKYYRAPFGILKIIVENDSLINIDFTQEMLVNKEENDFILKVVRQLDEYFLGQLKVFDLKMSLIGTGFQKNVWNELLNIEYGKTKSYKEIAIAIDNENASRAVGNANNRNKIAIVIPCHRVIGSDNKLVGYAGGLDIKKWLLNFEKDR